MRGILDLQSGAAVEKIVRASANKIGIGPCHRVKFVLAASCLRAGRRRNGERLKPKPSHIRHRNYRPVLIVRRLTSRSRYGRRDRMSSRPISKVRPCLRALSIR